MKNQGGKPQWNRFAVRLWKGRLKGKWIILNFLKTSYRLLDLRAAIILKKKPSVETEGYKPKPTAYEKKGSKQYCLQYRYLFCCGFYFSFFWQCDEQNTVHIFRINIFRINSFI